MHLKAAVIGLSATVIIYFRAHKSVNRCDYIPFQFFPPNYHNPQHKYTQSLIMGREFANFDRHFCYARSEGYSLF
jgi:hypothetical protein